jgi:hypothetical protein
MLSQWLVILIIVLILVLDVLLVLGLAALAILFVAFRAGKLVYDTLNKTIDRLVYAALCVLEDLLESPPLNRAPILSWALVGVKLAYDILNAFQNAIERAISVGVTVLSALLGVAAVGVLAAANVAALWLAWSYHFI